MRIGKEVLILSLDDVLPNRFQPRITFDEQAIMELADSIKEHGVIQPIVVRRVADKYEIIAGERRYKASVLAGKKSIPAILADLNDKDSAEVALIENVQRQDLTPIEEAISYKKILDMGYLNQAELANKLGKTQSTIANKLRLLNLTDEVQEALMKERISERHARSLLKLNESQQKMMLSRIISERLTVRKTDEEIEKIIKEQKGERNMLNDNNSQNINNFNTQANPTFPGFTPTNIEESKPISFGLNNDSSNNSIANESTVNIFGPQQTVSPIQPEPVLEQSFIPNPEPINLNLNNDTEGNGATQVFSNIFGASSTPQPEPQFEQQPVPNPEQNIFGLNNNFNNNNVVNEPPVNIFESQQPVSPVQPEPIVEEQSQNSQPNRFFGLFNNKQEVKQDEPKPEVLNTNQIKDPSVDFNTTQMAKRIEDKINNDFLNDSSINNNIFNFGSSDENNGTDSNNDGNNDGGGISVSPIFPNKDNIEELNFNEEIEPVMPFTLDDNEQFNNQNSQILSQSPSPVAIITPKEIPELEPVMPQEEEQVIGTINDMIRIIRDAIDEVESRGFKIDSDEMDLQNTYQITINIQK